MVAAEPARDATAAAASEAEPATASQGCLTGVYSQLSFPASASPAANLQGKPEHAVTPSARRRSSANSVTDTCRSARRHRLLQIYAAVVYLYAGARCRSNLRQEHFLTARRGHGPLTPVRLGKERP